MPRIWKLNTIMFTKQKPHRPEKEPEEKKKSIQTPIIAGEERNSIKEAATFDSY